MLIALYNGPASATQQNPLIAPGITSDKIPALENSLMQSNTAKEKYIPDVHECLEFALDMISEAQTHGCTLYLVNIESCKHFPSGHFIVCVRLETPTGAYDGVELFEPQTGKDITATLENDGEVEILNFINPTALTKVEIEKIAAEQTGELRGITI